MNKCFVDAKTGRSLFMDWSGMFKNGRIWIDGVPVRDTFRFSSELEQGIIIKAHDGVEFKVQKIPGSAGVNAWCGSTLLTGSASHPETRRSVAASLVVLMGLIDFFAGINGPFSVHPGLMMNPSTILAVLGFSAMALGLMGRGGGGALITAGFAVCMASMLMIVMLLVFSSVTKSWAIVIVLILKVLIGRYVVRNLMRARRPVIP